MKMPVSLSQSLIKELSRFRDEELVSSLRETTRVLKSAVTSGYTHWIIAFSGGKDSSLITVLAVELLRRRTIRNIQIDVVFSDTMMELPPFGENAVALIKYNSEIGARNSLPL
jgi:3'-phosphoadenosine 5'-phosphosulfate sulfotransferase (PAPS reductase)/FAD synthetase